MTKKPTNKDRDRAIGELFQQVRIIVQQLEYLGSSFAHYIEFRKDGKRYKRWMEKRIAEEQTKVTKMQKQQPQKEGVE